jgi:hypothetical protein
MKEVKIKMEEYELTLSHHGIKGMKWGIRRFQKMSGKLTAEGKKRYSQLRETGEQLKSMLPKRNSTKKAKTEEEAGEDYKGARSKSVKQMSDAELRSALNRFQMEQQYSQLTAKKKSAGRQWVESVISEAGKEIAKSYVSKYGKKLIDFGISKGSEKFSPAKSRITANRDNRRDHILKVLNKTKK